MKFRQTHIKEVSISDKHSLNFDKKVFSNPHRVLRNILPDETVPYCGLRKRRHNRELLDQTSRLFQCSFLARMLYKNVLTSNVYTLHIISSHYSVPCGIIMLFRVVVLFTFPCILIYFWLCVLSKSY